MNGGAIKHEGWRVWSITNMHELRLGPADLQAELFGLLVEHAKGLPELISCLAEQGGIIGVFKVIQSDTPGTRSQTLDIRWSMMQLKSSGAATQPCLTPLCMGNHSESRPFTRTQLSAP